MVFIIIAVILLQYIFAIFCLLKLAYMDVGKNRFIMWNMLILLLFFIGGAVFLVYYSKHPELRISKQSPTESSAPTEEQAGDGGADIASIDTDEPVAAADEVKQDNDNADPS